MGTKESKHKSSRNSLDIFLTEKVGSLNLHHLWDALCIEMFKVLLNILSCNSTYQLRL